MVAKTIFFAVIDGFLSGYFDDFKLWPPRPGDHLNSRNVDELFVMLRRR
jgi:hypothetical protein